MRFESRYAASFRILAAAALVIAAAVSCYRDDPLGNGAGGRTRVLLTDAPFPYDSVARVDLYIVEILATSDPDTTFLGQWWTRITEPHASFNLLDLQQGTTALVGEGDLPEGMYRAVRMIIDTDSSKIWARGDIDASGQPIPGRAPLPVNWGSSAGRPSLFALVEPPLEVAGTGGSIVIDFDVGRSFFPRYDGGFDFSPVLRAVNSSATGWIEGRVTGDSVAEQQGPIKDVAVTVYSGDPTANEGTWSVRATGRTDATGRFRIAYVLPGTYIVRSDAPRSAPFGSGLRHDVEVRRGAGTSGVNITLTGRTASTFTVTPSQRTVRVGTADTLYAYATDAAGRVIVGAAIDWTSSSPTIASVAPAFNQSSVAHVHAHRTGTAQVTAQWGDEQATATITVVADTGWTPGGGGPVESVTIYPGSANMLVGDSVGFMATLRDSAGRILTGRTVTWHSSDSTIVRPLGWGAYRAVRQGAAAVSAQSEGRTGSASVVVLP